VSIGEAFAHVVALEIAEQLDGEGRPRLVTVVTRLSFTGGPPVVSGASSHAADVSASLRTWQLEQPT